MISKSLDYAIRSMVFIAAHSERQYFGVREIAESIQVSRSYLSKILQTLVRAGYLESVTGPGGGFALARPPEDISLLELMEVVDGHTRIREKCIMGQAECSDDNPCPVHTTWKMCRAELLEAFRGTTLVDALKKSWPQYR